jgi:hypothetical protein
MAEETAAPAAGEGSELMSMLLEEVGGKPFVPEPQETPSSEEIIDSSDETEEPEAQAEASSEDVAEEAKDDESEDEEPEAAAPDKIQRRIDKLTAQKKEALEKAQSLESEATQAKTRLAELEAQLNESARPVLSPTAENPLADVDTTEALDAKIKSAQEVRRWALKNTDGATVKRPDGSEVYLDSDQVKDYLIKADDVLTIHAPQRQQWLSQRQPAIAAAKDVFPDIFKKGTDMHTAYMATVKQAPELLKLPQHEYWVGLALYGEQQLMANQKAQAAKATAAKKVSSAKSDPKTPTPANPVSSAKSSTKGTVRRDVRDRVMSGSAGLDDLEAFMSDKLFS